MVFCTRSEASCENVPQGRPWGRKKFHEGPKSAVLDERAFVDFANLGLGPDDPCESILRRLDLLGVEEAILKTVHRRDVDLAPVFSMIFAD